MSLGIDPSTPRIDAETSALRVDELPDGRLAIRYGVELHSKSRNNTPARYSRSYSKPRSSPLR